MVGLIQEDRKTKQKELAATTGLSRTAIYNILKKLQGMDVIRRIGDNKQGEWEVVDDMRKDAGAKANDAENDTKKENTTPITTPMNDTENALKTVEKTQKSSQKSSQKTVEKTQKSSQKNAKSSQKILVLIEQNPAITIEELAGELSLTSRAIKKNLAKLKRKGLIRRIGPDRGGYWEPA